MSGPSAAEVRAGRIYRFDVARLGRTSSIITTCWHPDCGGRVISNDIVQNLANLAAGQHQRQRHPNDHAD